MSITTAQFATTARIDVAALAAVLDATRAAVGPSASRREHRTRDFGIGYGSSSGYASARRYADNWGNVRFTCG